MMSDQTDSADLVAASDALRAYGVVPGVAETLSTSSAAISRELYAVVTDEVSAYTESGNPDVLPELQQHLARHVDEVGRLLGDSRSTDLGFVREHAQRRASQKFPLDAILHAYRCVHRVLSRWTRDAALATADDSAHVRRVVAAVTDFTIEYTGAIGTLITSEYVAHTRLLAEAEGDRRMELLNLLLSGYDESNRHAAQLLRRAGYLEQRQSYCVVAARSVDPREMESAARAQRMAEALSQSLNAAAVRTLVGVRDNLVILVVSGTRRLSGWTAQQSSLADRVYPHLRKVGPAALIGMSNDVPSTSHIPRAATEARLALDFATVAERVMLYSHIPFRQMLVSHARDSIESALPAWLPDFIAADRKARGSLSKTLRTYADSDMNVLRTAKVLAVHPNTIYARMQRINDITGRNALGYHALTELLLAADCA